MTVVALAANDAYNCQQPPPPRTALPIAMLARPLRWRSPSGLVPALSLLALGCGSAAVYYFAIARRWWLWDMLERPRRELVFLIRYDWEDTARFGAVVAGVFALYALACWASAMRGPRWLDGLVFLMAALGGVALLGSYPVTSNDVFYYIMSGRIFWIHGGNPLVDTPIQYPWDPYLFYSDWQASPAPYGPVWILSLGLAQLVPDRDPEVVVISYKALALGFHLLTGLAVWALAGRIAPERQRLAATFYAWNPLLLFATAVDGHNDVLMMFLAVLALYFAVQERWYLAMPAAALSVLSKYVTVVTVPLLLYYGWQRTRRAGRWSLALGTALALGVGMAALAPFWEGLDTFRATATDERTWLYVSLPETLYFGLNDVMPPLQAVRVARALGAALFLVPYLAFLFRLRPEPEHLVRSSYHALLFYLLIASGIFNPWYITWVVALAAPLADRAALVAGAFTLLGFMAAHRGPMLLLQFQRHLHMSPGRPLMAVVVMVPVAALWLGLEAHHVWERAQAGAKLVFAARSK